jgi:hypothetical protein
VVAAYGWPALIVLVAAALIASATTFIARSWQLSRHRQDLANVPARPASDTPRLTNNEKLPVLRSHS